MARAPQVDTQWATVRAARRAEAVKPRGKGLHITDNSLLVTSLEKFRSPDQDRREAALKIADMAAARHGCQLDPDGGVVLCTHPDHRTDVGLAGMALDVLGLDFADDDDKDTEPAPAPAPAKPDPRLGRTTFTRPDWRWQDNANCRGEDLNLFFGPDGERAAEREIREAKAKEVCEGCPVVAECLEEAIREPRQEGIWAGMDPDERTVQRRNILRRRKKRNAA